MGIRYHIDNLGRAVLGTNHEVKMTPKQERFVLEYLKDLNASAAYLRAGYKTGNPDVTGPRLLGNVGIKQAIQKAMDSRSKRVEVSGDYVLGNLKEVSERCLQRVPVMVGTGKDRKQLQVYATDPETGEEAMCNVWEFDAQGVLRANELIGKHLKMFTEKVEYSGEMKVTLSKADDSL